MIKNDRVIYDQNMSQIIQMKQYLIIIIGCVLIKPSFSQSTFPDSLTISEKITALSTVWSSAKQNFANFDLTTINWDSAYRATIPTVIASKSTAEMYREIAKMVALLKDGHTGVYHLPTYPRLRLPLQTEWIEGKVIISRIDNDSLTNLYGMQRGDEVRAINGVEVTDYAKKYIIPYQFASTLQDLKVKAYTHSLLYADITQPIEVTVLKKDGTQITRSISRNMQTLKQSPSFTLKMLPGQIALLTLNDFKNNGYKKLYDSLYNIILPAKALIIDIRRHTGGDGSQGNYILSHLINEPTTGAISKTKQYTAAFEALGKQNPWMELKPDTLKPVEGKQRFLKPIVLLTGAQTYSAAEDFCVAFDVSGRGIKIGQPTAGSTGQPLKVDLPGNGIFMICTKRDRYPNGKEFIGIGIQPEIFVKETVEDFQAGRDVTVEKAILFINGK